MSSNFADKIIEILSIQPMSNKSGSLFKIDNQNLNGYKPVSKLGLLWIKLDDFN